MKNEVKIKFLSVSSNEGFARVAISAFASQLNPTLEDLADIKTAISEAVTNAIVHGYENKKNQYVEIIASYDEECILTIEVKDEGIGINDIDEARQPFYTSKPDADRSGMGFTVMETFMDAVEVESGSNTGTTVVMKKLIKQPQDTQGDNE